MYLIIASLLKCRHEVASPKSEQHLAPSSSGSLIQPTSQQPSYVHDQTFHVVQLLAT
jgi:hypothetical protein